MIDLVIGDAELAKRLGVSLRTIERMNKEGLINEARYRRGRRQNAYDWDKVLQILKY